MSFAILIMGPSGSGKSTLTSHLQQIYMNLDIKTTIISLDPANETVKYKRFDYGIGHNGRVFDWVIPCRHSPNAAMLYSMQFLEKNLQWLTDKIKQKLSTLLIFDLPGQVELYINHNSIKNIIKKLTKMDISICTLQLFDCSYVYDLKHFMSLCMMSLATLVHFQTPHVNVLSKIDVMKDRRPNGDFTQILNCNSLCQMVQMLNSKKQDSQFLQAISKVIDSYGMVSFLPLDVSRIQLMANLIFDIQTSLGSIYTRQSNLKFKTMMEKFYKQPALCREIMRHDLQNQLFPQEAQDKQYYEKVLRSLQE